VDKKEFVRTALFDKAEEVPEFVPYLIEDTDPDSFLLDAGVPGEARALYVVQVREFHEPED
jgi:hypothetical protein